MAREMDDPRARFVSVTAVDVSKDLRTAKVYVTQINTGPGPGIDIRSLQKASGFLRSQLAAALSLKNVPSLTFVYDRSIERGVDLSRLIDRTVSEPDDSGL